MFDVNNLVYTCKTQVCEILRCEIILKFLEDSRLPQIFIKIVSNFRYT